MIKHHCKIQGAPLPPQDAYGWWGRCKASSSGSKGQLKWCIRAMRKERRDMTMLFIDLYSESWRSAPPWPIISVVIREKLWDGRSSVLFLIYFLNIYKYRYVCRGQVPACRESGWYGRDYDMRWAVVMRSVWLSTKSMGGFQGYRKYRGEVIRGLSSRRVTRCSTRMG